MLIIKPQGVANGRTKKTKHHKFNDRTEEISCPESFRAKAHISSMEQYEQMYKRSLEDVDGFWGKWRKLLIGSKMGQGVFI